ncbi:MAG: hypothetical protein GF401_16320 [Chitinivibrionales bacterium]|nr:hypothetical protein [Chitinivibrionales bacterium]
MDVWECALAFMDSQALLTAENLDIFTLLDSDPKKSGEIADTVAIPSDSAERLLDLLCSLKILTKDPEGRYHNDRQASNILVKGKPGYIGNMFVHLREDLYPLWSHLGETLAAGTSLKERFLTNGGTATGTDPDKIRAFILGMHPLTYTAGKEFAANAPELDEIESIVDIGGAGGSFLIACAERFPRLKGTVVDLTYVAPTAQELFRENNLEDRLDFKTADFFRDPLPNNADAYVLGFILHDWNDEQGSLLLTKIADVSHPGALLIIGEYLLQPDKTGPRHVVRANLNMLVAAKGRERTADEYLKWIEQYGFELMRIQMTKSLRAFLVCRRKVVD